MCGVVGYLGRFSRTTLETMLLALRHRGPDDRGLYVDDARSVGLGQTRLSIIDLSPTGHQPMTDGSGRYTTVFNGEIYNYRELRSGLKNQGVRFRGHSDTEVVLELYARIGTKVLERLNGIFAFGIWDKESLELFLARDCFGVKPLYYTSDARGFAFASELKALLPALRERTLNPAALHRYLSFLWSPGEGTPLREVRKLNPAEAMIVRDGQPVRRWTWYRLPAQRGQTADVGEAEAIAGTADRLRTAVRRQMVADVPVGAFLSGGLDSSGVVAFAREVDANLRCFTIELAGYHEPGWIDDLPYARRMAEHLGVRLDIVRVDANQMARDLPMMIEQLDEPLADPAPLNVLYICRLAREQGIKVMLSGSGGDDLFTGYRRHRALMAERYWAWLPRPIRAELKGITSRLDQRTAVGRRVAKLFNGAELEPDVRMAHYFSWSGGDTLFSLYTRSLRNDLGEEQAEKPLLDFLASTSNQVSRLERMLALEQRFFLGDHNLLYTDKMSMAAGVEVRVPFLDVDLVEFAARIPARLKQRGGNGKWVLKKALEPYLPREAIYRPKTGFGAPLRHWFRHELRAFVHDVLCEETLRRRGLFDPSAVQRLITATETGTVDGTYTLFGLIAIELWCRRYLDGVAPGQSCAPKRGLERSAL